MSDAAVVNSIGLVSGSRPPASFNDECLSAAEEAAERVLNVVRPTVESEKKRQRVIEYIKRLLKNSLDCEVFSFGSMPLKTYLPEGDIDLTAIKGASTGNSLVKDVYDVLNKETRRNKPEFQVKDVKVIPAKVGLVKCCVQNFVVDISFNQLGGLYTLCFLEQVNHLVARSHLLKRSIILVKAWCFYESRTLGAQYSLISTYALETLILYIIQLFHLSLSGPLSVLYKFLEYYSQFDWENYCINLKGPVRISSLPNIEVESPKGGWKNLMFGEDFLVNFMKMFPYLSRGPEENKFEKVHLNIFDPLNENNNIGRSVNKSSFNRIRFAFEHGATVLAQSLSRPKDKVGAYVDKFFKNTLKHGLHLRKEPFEPVDDGEYSPNLEASRLADLNVDYTHIETIKHAQSCLSSTSSATIAHTTPIQNQTPISTEQNSCPTSDPALNASASRSERRQGPNAGGSRVNCQIQIQISQIKTRAISEGQNLRLSMDPALPNVSDSERNQRQNAQETSTHFPRGNGSRPKRNQRKKARGTRTNSPVQNQFSQSHTPLISIEQNLYPSPDPALPVFTSLSERKQRQNAEGTGTNSPRGNDFNGERPSQSRDRNGAPGNNNRSNRYFQGNGNNSERVNAQYCEVPPGRSRGRNSFNGNGNRYTLIGRGGGRSDMPPQSRPSVENVNQNNDQSYSLSEIQFGRVGDLAKELLSKCHGAGGTRTNSPRGNDFNGERPSHARDRNGAPLNNYQSYGYFQANDRRNNSERVVAQYREVPLGQRRGTNNFERNSARGVPHGPSRGRNSSNGNSNRYTLIGRGRGRTVMPHQSRPSVENENQNNDESNSLSEIQFGTVGNLAKELLSKCHDASNASGKTGATKQQSDAGGSMRLTSSANAVWMRKGG